MKTKYKYIRFEEGVDCWFCYNNKSSAILGQIGYYPKWKQNIFVPSSDRCVFSQDCLEDIVEFMKQLKTSNK